MFETYSDCKPRITELVELIRAKKPATSLFLALYETFPKNVWSEAVEHGLMTPSEYQACMLILKQYRKMQAVSAIQKGLD